MPNGNRGSQTHEDQSVGVRRGPHVLGGHSRMDGESYHLEKALQEILLFLPLYVPISISVLK